MSKETVKQLRSKKTERREKEQKIGKHMKNKTNQKRQQKDSLGPKAVWAKSGKKSGPKAVWAKAVAADLSSSEKPVLLLSFLFLRTDLLLEVGILDDLVQSRSNRHVQHFKNSVISCPHLIAMTSIHPLNRPSTPL